MIIVCVCVFVSVCSRRSRSQGQSKNCWGVLYPIGGTTHGHFHSSTDYQAYLWHEHVLIQPLKHSCKWTFKHWFQSSISSEWDKFQSFTLLSANSKQTTFAILKSYLHGSMGIHKNGPFFSQICHIYQLYRHNVRLQIQQLAEKVRLFVPSSWKH